MPSSVVRAYSYDPADSALVIEFTTGRRYRYHGVPAETFETMKLAFAKGEFFNRHIRDRFAFTRLA